MNQKYDNTNKGVLFLNDRKGLATHPDRKGSINIDGKEYWLSGWDKQTSRGDTISLSAQPKDCASFSQKSQANASSEGNFQDDDLPF